MERSGGGVCAEPRPALPPVTPRAHAARGRARSTRCPASSAGPGATALSRTEEPALRCFHARGWGEKKTRFSVVIRTQNKTNPMRHRNRTWHRDRVFRHGGSEEMTFQPRSKRRKGAATRRCEDRGCHGQSWDKLGTEEEERGRAAWCGGVRRGGCRES